MEPPRYVFSYTYGVGLGSRNVSHGSLMTSEANENLRGEDGEEAGKGSEGGAERRHQGEKKGGQEEIAGKGAFFLRGVGY